MTPDVRDHRAVTAVRELVAHTKILGLDRQNRFSEHVVFELPPHGTA
jgi:hypothetical protein